MSNGKFEEEDLSFPLPLLNLMPHSRMSLIDSSLRRPDFWIAILNISDQYFPFCVFLIRRNYLELIIPINRYRINMLSKLNTTGVNEKFFQECLIFFCNSLKILNLREIYLLLKLFILINKLIFLKSCERSPRSWLRGIQLVDNKTGTN